MDAIERLLVERACERLIVEYARRIDFGEADRIADLFTEDGCWEGTDLVLSGRDAIHEWFETRGRLTRRVSRHVCTNVAVEALSATEARSLSYMVNYRFDRPEGSTESPVPAGPPKYVGELHDSFRLTDEGWRFTSRRVTVTFQRPRAVRPDLRTA
jgi:nuclear transport factor 2 (NTF2) superfamily protein